MIYTNWRNHLPNNYTQSGYNFKLQPPHSPPYLTRNVCRLLQGSRARCPFSRVHFLRSFLLFIRQTIFARILNAPCRPYKLFEHFVWWTRLLNWRFALENGQLGGEWVNFIISKVSYTYFLCTRSSNSQFACKRWANINLYLELRALQRGGRIMKVCLDSDVLSISKQQSLVIRAGTGILCWLLKRPAESFRVKVAYFLKIT